MPEITLYFVTGKDNLISRIIRGAELGFPYSHVGAILPDGRLVSAHAPDGVQIRTEVDESPWERWAYIYLPCTQLQATVHTNWLFSQIGKPYDMEAIGYMAEGLLASKPTPSGWPSAWICSSLQFEAIAHPDVGLFPWRPSALRTVTPEMLMYACTGVPGSRMVIR
jgi:hypothetical protein